MASSRILLKPTILIHIWPISSFTNFKFASSRLMSKESQSLSIIRPIMRKYFFIQLPIWVWFTLASCSMAMHLEPTAIPLSSPCHLSWKRKAISHIFARWNRVKWSGTTRSFAQEGHHRSLLYRSGIPTASHGGLQGTDMCSSKEPQHPSLEKFVWIWWWWMSQTFHTQQSEKKSC